MQTALKEIGALLSDLLRLHSDPPPPPPSENIPTVESTVAASGHAYVSETRHLRAKEKVKTKGSAVRTDLELADEEEEEILPESLPADFKIGKILLKVNVLALPIVRPRTEHPSGLSPYSSSS
jgi:hypothetical protein